jgi:hypothetical protein
MYENELYHHGIKGMRWGVRRYQNEDGSYTRAGRKRYGMDLDINDKSKTNIAKIRLGEARRRLDVAKTNNSTNTSRLAELTIRERSAKRAVKQAKDIDSGAKRLAKGETISGNSLKAALGYAAAYAGSHALTNALNYSMSNLASQGRLTAGHIAVAKAINDYGGYGMYALSAAYSFKKAVNNDQIRRYNNARSLGTATTKHLGSSEYADRVKRAKNK